MHIVDMWVGVGRTSLNITLVIDHMVSRINDLLLPLDCVSGPLTEGKKVILCTSVRDLPLSRTIWCKR